MIVDFHTHAFPPAIAARTLRSLAEISGVSPMGDGTRESVVREMRAAGADLAVVLNVVTKPGQETTVNNTAHTLDCLSSGEGNTVYFGSVHPDSPHAAAEVCRIAALGLKGVKIHPDYQKKEISDEAYYPIYEQISRLGLILVSHAGWDPLSPEVVHAPPEKSARVLRDFPHMKVVLAHYGGMYRYDEVEEHLAGKFENLYLDTSFSAGLISPFQARRIIEKQGAERMLFGSDFPWHTTREELEFLRSLGLSAEQEEQILGGNALRLLGVDA